MNIKHRPKSLRLSGLTDVCGKVSVYELKFPILSNVTLDKFFLPIAVPNIRRHFGWLGLLAV